MAEKFPISTVTDQSPYHLTKSHQEAENTPPKKLTEHPLAFDDSNIVHECIVLSQCIQEMPNAYSSSRQGLRTKQEDATKLYVFKQFPVLSDTQVVTYMQEAVDDFVAKISKNVGLTGSTFLANLIIKTQNNKIKIYTFWLGDSQAKLITYHQGNATVEALTWMHKPSDADEKIRVSKANGTIVTDYFGITRVALHSGQGLAITRAILQGDRYQAGIISKQLSYTIKEVQQADATQTILMQCCDGFSDILNEKNTVQLLNKKDFTPNTEMLAFRLGKAAYQYGSKDNITITCIPLSFSWAQGNMLLSLLADGFGGKTISQHIVTTFHLCLQGTIKKHLSQQTPTPSVITPNVINLPTSFSTTDTNNPDETDTTPPSSPNEPSTSDLKPTTTDAPNTSLPSTSSSSSPLLLPTAPYSSVHSAPNNTSEKPQFYHNNGAHRLFTPPTDDKADPNTNDDTDDLSGDSDSEEDSKDQNQKKRKRH